MEQEDKELLLKDLCARLPYGVKCQIDYDNEEDTDLGIERYRDDRIVSVCTETEEIGLYEESVYSPPEYVKPYLFPLSSMTEEEAKELSVLYGIKDVLSINITDEYIDFKVDDGFCSFERKTIWYNEIISSTETFDWLNKNHFDYRGLIEKGLAIDATGLKIY